MARPSHFNKKDEQEQMLTNLWKMIASLQDEVEVENFFKDLLSDSETVMIARRVKIASLLLQGRTYDQIEEMVSTSSTTIASVHQWLQRKSESERKHIPALQHGLSKKTEKHHKETKAPEDPMSFSHLKKKYPLHFFLFNLFDEVAGSSNTSSKKSRKANQSTKKN